jgi:hypothetical protein
MRNTAIGVCIYNFFYRTNRQCNLHKEHGSAVRAGPLRMAIASQPIWPLPLLHLAVTLPTNTAIRPVLARDIPNITKSKTERNRSTVLRLLRCPSNKVSHICRHPSRAAAVDGQTWVLPSKHCSQSSHQRLGNAVASSGSAKARCILVALLHGSQEILGDVVESFHCGVRVSEACLDFGAVGFEL